MRKLPYSFLFLIACFSLSAQDLVRYDPIKADIRGGNAALDQVLQTQLTLPKNFFQGGFSNNVNVYFLLDSSYHPAGLVCRPELKPAAKKEMKRILNFLAFSRIEPDLQVPYYITIPLNAEKYNSYTKQKQKPIVKASIKADSSMAIVTRADKSPEYYKGGEEGLKEYLLSEMEYPKTAIDKSVEGNVLIEFTVETNGYITNIILKQGLGAGCSDEALRLIQKTRWQPAMQNGKLVRYRMTYPITFSLRNTNRDRGFSN